MNNTKGSFLGFTFNGIHSSELGITRVIKDGRIVKSLAPVLKDKNVNFENGVNTIYFGTNYCYREITVFFVYDSLTDQEIKFLKKIYNDKKNHDLILDEEPYKIYSCKLTSSAILKHLAFEENGIRIYKGEGTFVFKCYNPYARSRFQYQEDYIVSNIPEWIGDQYKISDSLILTNAGETGSIIYDIEKPKALRMIKQSALVVKEVDELPQPENIKNPRIIYAIGNGDNTKFYIYNHEILEFEEIDSSIISELANFFWVDDKTLLKYYPNQAHDYNSSFLPITDDRYKNIKEWIESSKIPSKADYGLWDNSVPGYKIYNAGDIPMPFKLTFRLPKAYNDKMSFNINLNGHLLSIKNLQRKYLSNRIHDEFITIDIASNSIYGSNEYLIPSGLLYNEYIDSEDFFSIPLGEQILKIEGAIPYAFEFKYYYL